LKKEQSIAGKGFMSGSVENSLVDFRRSPQIQAGHKKTPRELRLLYESLLGMIKDELGGHGDPEDIEELYTEMADVKEVDPELNIDSKVVDEVGESPGERKKEDIFGFGMPATEREDAARNVPVVDGQF
jgi:hypothetical protein